MKPAHSAADCDGTCPYHESERAGRQAAERKSVAQLDDDILAAEDKALIAAWRERGGKSFKTVYGDVDTALMAALGREAKRQEAARAAARAKKTTTKKTRRSHMARPSGEVRPISKLLKQADELLSNGRYRLALERAEAAYQASLDAEDKQGEKEALRMIDGINDTLENG